MKKKMILAVMLAASSLSANASDKLQLSFKCDFNQSSNVEGKVKDKLSINYLIDGNKAYISGNVGASEVAVLTNGKSFTFIEHTQSGTTNTATLLLRGNEDNLSMVADAVMSRNVIINVKYPELVPSQFYGTCTVSGL